MELLTGTVPTITFNLPTPDTTVTNVTWTKDGVAQTPNLVPSLPIVNNMASVRLPYQPEEVKIVVTWNFTVPNSGNHTKKETYQVVTPYISIPEVTEMAGEDFSPSDIVKMEAAVRHIINAHTGQTFGKETSTKVALGNGSRALALPARLISVNTINGVALPVSYNIGGDGWFITHPSFGIPPLRADYHGLHESNGVIENPYGVRANQFGRDARFEIAGTWGWETVPDAVTEAARLLVNDYGSGDSLYRDRYLVSMTAADWRIQFSHGAFAKTGNVRADQLLSDYVLKRGWAVI